MVPVLGNITYQWDDPAMQTTQTAVGLTAGTYTCTITSDIGCQGVVVVNVTEIPGMIGNIVNQTDVTCNSGNDGFIEVNVIQGTAPYTYSWDNSTSTLNYADDLAVGPHTVTVTDANGCVITVSGVLNEPAPLSINFLTPDTQICPEDDIQLIATGVGGSSPYTFTWYENGTQIGTGDMITVDPDVTNTQYCVELTEACGSPMDSQCNLIYFPTPIIPSAVPDETEKCVEGFFEFTNTSTNIGEIASTYWDFGSNELTGLEIGGDSTSFLFTEVGTYDLIMTATSIYGCVYTDTVKSIMEVKPTPTADFFFSTNPATIFETTVFMQDKSSPDVVSWNWFSPGSNPATSASMNPVLVFPDGVVGQYPVTLAVMTERGCVDTVTYLFNVIEDILFYAPNTFTPDGDEFNQTWVPSISGIDIYNFDLFIFNRWGELIWESHDPSAGWDGTYNGKQVPQGTYVWRARVFNLVNDGKAEFNGFINVIR
jgi:gliding motility-associated-like protein